MRYCVVSCIIIWDEEIRREKKPDEAPVVAALLSPSLKLNRREQAGETRARTVANPLATSFSAGRLPCPKRPRAAGWVVGRMLLSGHLLPRAQLSWAATMRCDGKHLFVPGYGVVV